MKGNKRSWRESNEPMNEKQKNRNVSCTSGGCRGEGRPSGDEINNAAGVQRIPSIVGVAPTHKLPYLALVPEVQARSKLGSLFTLMVPQFYASCLYDSYDIIHRSRVVFQSTESWRIHARRGRQA